jgi:hypothetical protein
VAVVVDQKELEVVLAVLVVVEMVLPEAHTLLVQTELLILAVVVAVVRIVIK